MSTNKSVAKSASVIGFATLASRILGFARDVVIARLFGVYIYAQAFVIAFKIPNLFRDFIGEGATNAAFVPVFSEYNAKRSKEEFWELVNIVLYVFVVVLLVITAAGVLFAPAIVRLIAPGFVATPEKLSVTIRLTRLLFPYFFLISLAAYIMGILNTLKHFSVPAFAPCLFNISIILFAALFGEGVNGLALGVLVGGLLQLAIQIPVLYKKGFRLRLPKRFKHPAVKTLGVLMAPRLLSSSIYQLNNFVDSIFGSLAWIVGEGGVAILYFSYRLILFPLGLISSALSQAILPTLSTQALEDDRGNLRHTLSWGLRTVFFLMVPASLGFMVFSRQIISALFQGGKFDLYSVNLTSQSLFFYSIGLCAYGGARILQSCFFAIKDTITPTKVAFLTLIMNIVLNAVFIFPLKVAGIALATSISGIISFAVLFVLLIKKIGDFHIDNIFSSFARILSAGLLMALVCYGVSGVIAVPQAPVSVKFLNLTLLVMTGTLSYIMFCFLFKVQEMREMWQWLARKKGLSPPKP